MKYRDNHPWWHVIPLVTSRLHSHWQGSAEKTSKGSTLPSSGMQHKGSTSSVATRKTLNMTVLQFHSALGCSPLLERKLTLIASSQTYPFSSCKPPKSNSECHMETNTCTSNTFLRTKHYWCKWQICVSRCQATTLWFVFSGAQGASRRAQNRDAEILKHWNRDEQRYRDAQKMQRNGLHCSAANWTKTYLSLMLAQVLGWRPHPCSINPGLAHTALLNPSLLY